MCTVLLVVMLGLGDWCLFCAFDCLLLYWLRAVILLLVVFLVGFGLRLMFLGVYMFNWGLGL